MSGLGYEPTLSASNILLADQNLFELENVVYQYTYNISPQPNWKETSETACDVTEKPHSFQPSGTPQSPTSIVIDLNRVYLVNNITLEIVGVSSPYTIQVSRDNKTWSQLIDYSIIKMICSSRQILWFPKQAVRYFFHQYYLYTLCQCS